ncbi:MAG: hypothetical protein K2M07_07570 [Muribaculaceae bacterium]|nr:hypothetical protein [Muribaculaceae bacterium]
MNINFRHIFISLAVILGLFSTACSDDNEFRSKTEDQQPLSLMVPSAGFSSRATDATEPELQYTSLFFFAYNQNTSKPAVIIPLHETDDNNQLNVLNGWRSYPLELEQGNYHFYLVANVWDKDAATSSLPQTEDLMKQGYLEFASNMTCDIPSTGLAMSAGHTDFSFTDLEGQTTSMTTDQWFHYDGEGGSLYAILSFLYAKITIVPQDAAGDPVEVSDLSFSNISESEPLIFKSGYDYGSISTVTPYQPEDTPEAIDFYIPERYIAATAPLSQSSLSFKIGEKEVTLPLGAVAGTYEDEVNNVPSAEQYRELERGVHYTYTLVTTDKITLEVQKWTPEIVAAKLAGPVYLHIEQQVYEVSAGEITPIWFDSNAANVRVESPEYTTEAGEVLKLYDYSVDANQDTIRVWVNDAVPANEYAKIKQSINAEEGLYDYVHIVAGNINKRITIYPLNLDNYLLLNPQSMAIDVKLRVASGEYSGMMPVSIRSNYPQVKVTLEDGWSDLPQSEFGTGITPSAYPLKVNELTYDADNNPVLGAQVTTSSPTQTVMTGGKIYYAVSFSGLNSGKEVWKTDRTLTFKVQGIDADGNPVEGSEEYFTINIIPSILNYKIHFKAQNGDWSLPHIYIYQCLEFPADYTQTATFEGVQQSLALKPIGYYRNNATNSIPVAAIEYSFSGALGFRGWEYPVNFDLLYNADGSEKTVSGSTNYGFFIFNGQNNSWDFQNYPDDAKKRYNTEMDFCHEHREYVSDEAHEYHCTQCAWTSSDMNRMWPGIMMKYEDDGWFEFELTGIAEPGKTLIMFADGHGGNDDRRFPGNAQVGVPLFDYPSREGWFLYNGVMTDRVNNQFHSEKPGSVITEKTEYRIYWPENQTNSDQVHVWVAGGSGITNWADGGKSEGTLYGYRYFTFESDADSSKQFGFKFHTGDNAYAIANNQQEFFTNVTTFTANENGVLCAYFTGNGFVSGEPPVKVIDYRIYWPSSMGFDKIYCWYKVGTNDVKLSGEWPGIQGTLQNGYYYYDFTYNGGSTDGKFWYLITRGSGEKYYNDDQSASFSTFSYDASLKKNCAYLNTSNNTLSSGKPN